MFNSNYQNRPRFALLAGLCLTMISAASTAHAQNKGIRSNDKAFERLFDTPKPVRNRQPVLGEEITILRSFKIKKGTYAEFRRRSAEGIWPYFEKIGARIIGMWQVNHDALDSGKSKDYDEAILLTRYASMDHWKASRTGTDIGGNGPDAKALIAAHQYRQSVTLETTFQVLKGKLADNGPYFMPAVKD